MIWIVGSWGAHPAGHHAPPVWRSPGMEAPCPRCSEKAPTGKTGRGELRCVTRAVRRPREAASAPQVGTEAFGSAAEKITLRRVAPDLIAWPGIGLAVPALRLGQMIDAGKHRAAIRSARGRAEALGAGLAASAAFSGAGLGWGMGHASRPGTRPRQRRPAVPSFGRAAPCPRDPMPPLLEERTAGT